MCKEFYTIIAKLASAFADFPDEAFILDLLMEPVPATAQALRVKWFIIEAASQGIIALNSQA